MVAPYWNPNQLLGYFPKKKVKGSEMKKKKKKKNNRKHVNQKCCYTKLLDACIEHVHYKNEQSNIKPNIFVKKIKLCCKGCKHSRS
jgi:hypothetical protein